MGQRSEQSDTLPKKIHSWQISRWKDVWHNMSLGNCKLKQLDTTLRMAEIQNTDNAKSWWGCRAAATLILCCWEYKMVQPLWKTICHIRTKLDTLILSDPAVVLLGITQRCWKLMYTELCTWIVIVALFIIAKTRKETVCEFIFSRWTDNRIVVYPDNGMLFDTERQWAVKLWKET